MRRGAAKAAYWVGGKLSRIKTLQRYYSWDGDYENPTFICEGRHWYSCRLSMRILRLSERIDPQCWDHWALEHASCDPTGCPECGGRICGYQGEDE